MQKLIRIHIGEILNVAVGDEEQENRLWHELRTLADELNASLEGYEVTLEHLDTSDYITFRPVPLKEIEE